MKIIITILLLIFGITETVFSQSTISGTVKDSLDSPLPQATIQVLDSLQNNLLAYAISDEYGGYKIEVEASGVLFIKASFLGFKPAIKKIKLDSEDVIIVNFQLKELTSSLEEVVLQFDYSLADVRKDTIIYNLKNLTNGQENKLRDIIEKLPGAEIDENGKVKVNGQQVDKLLIDGDTFFNNQHQMATENITADMVDGITFFQKYEDFTHIDGFDSNSTALNISLKEEYKNRITGSVEGLGGIKNKYEAHTNLFRFGGKLKLTFIGDVNNTGKQAISYSDYIQLNSGVGQFSGNKNTGVQTRRVEDEDVPVFLHPSLDVANRELQLSAFNFTYSLSNKIKLSGFSILNNASQKQLFAINRFYLDSPALNQVERKKDFGDFFFNSSVLNADYRINDNSVLNYTLNYNSGKDDQKSFIENSIGEKQSILDQRNIFKRYSLGQEISLEKKVGQKTLLTINGVVELFNNTGKLTLESNNPFLGFNFEDEPFFLKQKKLEKQNKYGLTFLMERNIEIGNITFSGGSTIYDERFNTGLNSDPTAFSNNLSRNKSDSYFGMDFFYKTNSWLSLYGGLSYHYFTFKNNLTKENDYFNGLFPSVGFTAKLQETGRLNFSYTYKNTFPELQETINNSYIENYLSIVRGTSISSDAVLPEHNFNASYISSKISSGTSLFLLFNYTKKPKNLTFNTTVRPEIYSIKEYDIGNSYDQVSSSLNFDKKFRKAKLSASTSSTFFYLNYENFIDSNLNEIKITSFKEDLGLNSNFKTALNFSTGISFIYKKYHNSINDATFSSTRIDPYINITGYHNEGKFYWGLDLIYKTFKSNNLNRSFFQIDPSANYLTQNKKWRFYIKGNNVLNLNSPEIAQIINSGNFYEERVSKSLEGYLGLGINYSF